MRHPARPALATLFALAIQPWLSSMSFGQFGGVVSDDEVKKEALPGPRAFYHGSVTPQAARAWAKLDKAMPNPFEKEMTLEDALQLVRRATAEPGDTGILIYVDPFGLYSGEMNKIPPVIPPPEGTPLRTALKLMLKPLDLAYEVQEDGIVFISSPWRVEPTALILDELRALRAELAELRKDVATARGKSAAQSKGPAGTMRTGGVSP
jgi:hypothetical protein